MSKAVLISIRPEWCEKIINREKIIEVRKTRPKISTPFKCYIYCTKPKSYSSDVSLYTDELYRLPSGEIKYGSSVELSRFPDQWNKDNFLNGKIIGEFICDRIIEEVAVGYSKGYYKFDGKMGEIFYRSLLFPKNIHEYLGYKKGYGWHISNLVIYDKPKELSEFRKPGYRTGYKIVNDNKRGVVSIPFDCENVHLQRPPQSWCYVQERVFI